MPSPLVTETGFSESSVTSGEGMDKGDKGIYKAQTGALKYYLSVTFMVATGDDPEQDDKKEAKTETKAETKGKATPEQIRYITEAYGEKLPKLLEEQGLERLEDMAMDKASEFVKKIQDTIKKQKKGDKEWTS